MIKSIDIAYLKHFFAYAKNYKKFALIGIAMLPISILANMLFPLLTIKIIDNHLMTEQYQGLVFMCCSMVAVLVANYFADAVYAFFLRKTGQLAIRDIRNQLFHRVLHLPKNYFDNTATGITLSRLTSDLEAIGESFVLGALNLVKDSLNTIAILLMMLFIDWKLTLVILVIFPPILYLTQYVRNKLRAMYLITRSSLAKSTGYLQELLLGIKTVQLYGAQNEVEQKYATHTKEFLRAQLKTNKYDAALFSIITGITSITIGLIIWFGAQQIIGGVLTLGVLIAFINTLEKVFVPIRDFTSQIASIQRSFAAFEHIEELFSQPLEEQTLIIDSKMQERLTTFNSLEFKDVYFQYSKDSPFVLNGISFKLENQQQLALVGTTGSGKSTILRLINKVYLEYQGSILLNGIELRDIPKQYVIPLFSLMQQDVYLFEKSIAFNIGLAKYQYDNEVILEAAKFVYADEFISQLENGYDFILEKNGTNLSAGQTQLISFARAIAQQGQVMMLDEATSSVDSVTESLIQKAISKLFEQKTVIAIAHRLSTIKHSDCILVLDKGLIVEQGNHEQLVSIKGFYNQLLNSNEFDEE